MAKHGRPKSRSSRMVTIRAAGKKPITFRAGALHRALGVPEGKPIPPGKKERALRGDYGKRVKKMAVFAFKGALAAGRRTAARGLADRRSAARRKARG